MDGRFAAGQRHSPHPGVGQARHDLLDDLGEIFWYTTLHSLRDTRIGGELRRFHSGILVLGYVVIVVLILQEFWSYWRTLL
ncbi:hypothetical protein [Amycolatopsis sp. NBC_01286]|uniref:hypothetical protein n=1 Tax=Amycolatopsis sp. NBC_01286 TaxID=2903560 RepID=UPI002E1058C1|nr:hypothetical protein OG570_26670 [Amycolatopsis sp. NBC_01286]